MTLPTPLARPWPRSLLLALLAVGGLLVAVLGLASGLLALVRLRDVLLAFGILLDFLVAAGLLRLAGEVTATGLVAVVLVIAVRKLAVRGLRADRRVSAAAGS